MSSHLHHTKTDAAWESDILPRLPADLDAQAVALRALVRKRSFACAADLLRGLLAYVGTVGSLRELSCWGVTAGVAELAASSWLERLQAAGPWLQWIVSTVVQAPRPRWLSQSVQGRVLLVDATMLRWHGGTGDDLRLHLAFDLLAGRLDQLVLSDHHGAEHVQHFGLRAGDLYVLDGGYGYRDRLARIQQARADGLLRIYPPTFPLETADGKPLDMRAWLDQPGAAQRSRLAYYRQGGQRYAVRVLAARQPELQRQAARRRAQARARKRQRPLHALTEYYADWVVMVSSLSDATTWPDHALWRLYGARWQVELLIQRLKQFLGLGQLPARGAASGVPLVWAMLVLWVLHEPLAQEVRRALVELADPAPATLPGQLPVAEAVVSTWSVSALLLDGLRQAIRGTWGIADVQACLPRLRRFLVSHPRASREHQLTEVVAWLSGIRRTRRRPLLDAV
jgi:hypothetical protein